MISEEKKFIFIHIPKTGGSSITKSIEKYSTNKIIWKNKNEVFVNHKDVPNYKHRSMDQLISIHNNEFKDYFKFTIVRNPYDRILSFIFWSTGGRNVNNKTIDHYITKIKPLSWFMGDHKFNYIIKFENLVNDFEEVCRLLKLDIIPLKQLNKSAYNHKYKNYLTKSHIEKINEKHKQDFIYFGYKMD
jgi:hypothetical protein